MRAVCPLWPVNMDAGIKNNTPRETHASLKRAVCPPLKVSPWITADPRKTLSSPTAPAGRHRHPVGEDKASCCGAQSLHMIRETSVDLEELQHLFLHKRPLYIH